MEVTINSLKYADPNETVVEIGWGASIWETVIEPVEEVLDADGNVVTAAVEGEIYSAAVSGTQELERDGDSPTFIPYDDLTEDVVMQWLRDSLDEDLAIKAVSAADAIEAVEGVEEVVDDDGNVITAAVEEVDAVDAVEEVVGVAGLTVLENQIAGYIVEQKNPQVEKGLPW